jgi:hypothetical protein
MVCFCLPILVNHVTHSNLKTATVELGADQNYLINWNEGLEP